MTYGGRLRGLREDCDCTQTQLAEMFHVSQKAISNWENGRNKPPYDVLIKYAKFFRSLSGFRGLFAGFNRQPNSIEEVNGNYFCQILRFFTILAFKRMRVKEFI